MRINHRFREYIDLKSLEKGIKVTNIRIIAKVRFKTKTEWSESFSAIVDAGSPLSVIPKEVWESCVISKLYKSQIKGIVPDKNVFIPATFGSIEGVLIDEKQCSPLLEANALFAERSDIPLILGFSNLIEKMKLVVNYPKRKSWVEI